MNSLFNIQHLKFFYDTVHYGSVSEAAKKNFVTQSAVSQGIAKLEKSFKSVLIFREGQKLQLSEEGKILYQQASEIFRAIRETQNKVSQAQERVAGIVHFTSSHSIGLALIPQAYQKLKELYPEVEIRFKMGGANLIRAALKRETVEFALSVDGAMFDQFERRPVLQGMMHLYQPKKAPKKLIEQGIYVDKPDGLHVRELDLQLEERYPIKSFNAGWEFTANFVNSGMGIGFLPDCIAKSGRYPNLEVHPGFAIAFPYQVSALSCKSRVLSRAAEAFLECLAG